MLMVIWGSGIRYGYHQGRIDEQAFQEEQDQFDDDIYRRMPDFN